MKHVATLKPAYRWSVENFKKNKPKRAKMKKEFLYTVTYQNSNFFLDDMEDWCYDKFGDRYGKCHWRNCEYGFDLWHDKHEFEEILHDEIFKKLGSKPDQKNKNAWDIWQNNTKDIIHNHYTAMEKRMDYPHDHSHNGIWSTLFLAKTGYDYGYQDFYFRNPEDAVYFKIMWDEKNS